ncbi:unnamed protein product, partial [Rotaria sp. Silwood1]
MGHLWLKARSVFLVSKNYSKTLPWFPVACSGPDGEPTRDINTIANCQKYDSPDTNSGTEIGSGRQLGCKYYWNSSIRKLLDLIITRWDPAYLNENISMQELHGMLTSSRLRKLDDVVCSLNETNYDSITEEELMKFYSCVTVLYYHEVWGSMMREHRSIEMPVEDRIFNIDVKTIEPNMTGCETKETALIVGTTIVISNQHTLIRIGSQPPIDEDLSNNFLDFLVLEKIFETLQQDSKTERVDLSRLQ